MKDSVCMTAPTKRESTVALGLFDGVHPGHRAVLETAAQSAARHRRMACAFTFAADSVPVKQGVPMAYLYTDAQKARLMGECGIEAVYCPPFDTLCGLDGEAFCREILVRFFHAREVFCGGDFRFGARAAWNIEDLGRFGEALGFTVHRIAPVLCDGEKISSTEIRKAVLAGNPERAARLLGKPYHICGKVVHGAAFGRTQNVPTINMPFAKGQLVPRCGVYVSRTYTDRGMFDSVTDIGVKPTVSDAQMPTAETHLTDFSGDLYEQPCRVELLHFLREERKFPNTEELYRQIAEDIKSSREWLKSEGS